MRTLASALCMLAAAPWAVGQTLNFEVGNSSLAPSDNASVSSLLFGGVSVNFRTSGYGDYAYGAYTQAARLEQYGPQAGLSEGVFNGGWNYNFAPTSGFMYNDDNNSNAPLVDTVSDLPGLDGLGNRANREASLGQFFLSNAPYSRDSMTVTLDTTIDFATFQMWDVDGLNGLTEAWKITAFNADWSSSSVVFTTTVAPVTNADASSYDGQAYLVTLNPEGDAVFDRFVIEFVGTKAPTTAGVSGAIPLDTVGMVLDNFYFESNGQVIPEPSTYAAILGLGTLCLAAFRGRRRSAMTS